MSAVSSMSQSSWRAESNAMLFPSGVQVGDPSSKTPEVRSYASADT